MAYDLKQLQQMLNDQEHLSAEQLDVAVATLRAIAEKQGILVGDPCEANPAILAEVQTKKRRYKYIYEAAPHLALLGEELRAFADGERSEYRGLLVSMPPRSSKSETASVWTPLWLLKRNPRTRIILASYGAEKAVEWGRAVRDFILDNPDFGISLNKNVLAASGWTTTQGGGMWTAGVGGPLTGKGSDFLLIDDAQKDAAEAYSKVIREKVRAWFNTVALTRLEPAGFICVLGTRWHEDDLIGSLERDSVDGKGIKFKVISFPALAEKEDILGRQPGDPLWPTRWPLERVEEIKKGLSPYEWSALYQQRPAPEEGAAVKRVWWKFTKTHPAKIYEEAEQVIFSFDLALKETEQGSFNVGLVIARKGSESTIIDFWRRRCDFPTTLDKFRQWSAQYPRATAKVVEDKASGPALIATLAKTIPGIVPMPATGSKLVRLQAVIPLIQAGNIYLLDAEANPWVKELIEECAAFPNGQYDDIVDTLSHGLRYIYPSVWQHLDAVAREGADSAKAQEAWSEEADRSRAHSKYIREAIKVGVAQMNGDALMVGEDPRRLLC